VDLAILRSVEVCVKPLKGFSKRFGEPRLYGVIVLQKTCSVKDAEPAARISATDVGLKSNEGHGNGGSKRFAF